MTDSPTSRSPFLDLKILILAISIILMIVVVLLAVAGVWWALTRSAIPPVGGRVVLFLSGAAALACLWRLWTTRHDHRTRN